MGFSNNEHVLEVRQSSFLPKKKVFIPRRYAITTFNPKHIDYLHDLGARQRECNMLLFCLSSKIVPIRESSLMLYLGC